MFKQIFVPLDGSARAEQALPVAACLARATDGTVKLIKVVSPPTTDFIRSVGTVVLPDLLDEDVQAAQEYLEGISRASCLEGVRTAREVHIGHPAQTIIATAKAGNSDLIVMCSHGQTNRVRWSLGSIAEKVARYAPCPVFIMREGSAFATKMEAVPRGSIRILVPLDGSEHAEAAIMPAAWLASTLSESAQGELHLTRVVSAQDAEASNVDEEEVARTRQYLRSTVERLQQQPPTVGGMPLDLSITWSVTVASDAASGINRSTEKSEKRAPAEHDEGSHVIAMATHGWGGPQLWAVGSTTERVLQTAWQPLLIMRR